MTLTSWTTGHPYAACAVIAEDGRRCAYMTRARQAGHAICQRHIMTPAEAVVAASYAGTVARMDDAGLARCADHHRAGLAGEHAEAARFEGVLLAVALAEQDRRADPLAPPRP